MKEQFADLLCALDGKKDTLTLAELEHAIELFEVGLSGDFVARELCGEFGLELPEQDYRKGEF